jgi:UDP-hydrolysing UDP-N-acetyl-D-glucosamine 2-epimerase
VASEDAKQRVIKLGENPDMVFNTGCPSIDLAAIVKANPILNFDPYVKYGGVGNKPDLSNGYVVVMQHPVTNEYQESRKHIEETLHALEKITKPILWFWPNVDAGADGTSTGIRAYREKHKATNMHFFKNMEGEDFLRLLVNADCLIGNSSVGIRECAFLGVHVINVGSRQNKRERGNNVIDVDYNAVEIFNAFEQINRHPKPTPSHIYGGGDAGKKIAVLLAQSELRFHKTISY